MGKSKNKTCSVGMRLTQNERDMLNDILDYRGIGISEFLVKVIEKEGKKIKKEQEQEMANGEKQEQDA